MTSPNFPLVLYMFGDTFQGQLLHHLPRDQGEADKPAAPQMLPEHPEMFLLVLF